MRVSPVPVAVVGVLLGLVYLLPERAGGIDPIRREFPAAPPLDVVEPPAYTLQRGAQDDVLRSLDRLAWGGHAGLVASMDHLRDVGHDGALTPEVLSRLEALGPHDPIQTAKLVTVLANGPTDDPAVLDMLVQQALSWSTLVTMQALRALAYQDDPLAMMGIYPRLGDPDPSVRQVARSALAYRAKEGDREAQHLILEEVAAAASNPDLAYLVVLEHFEENPEAHELLTRIANEGDEVLSLIAWAGLLRSNDPAARAHFEDMLAADDHVPRVNALRVAASARVVLGEEVWEAIVDDKLQPEVLTLAAMLLVAVDEGHPSAPEAQRLLEKVAMDPLHPCTVEVTDALFERNHPWAIEKTRGELKAYVGAQLNETVSRVIRGGGAVSREMATLAFERLGDPHLRDVERVLLARLVAHVDPARAADLVVRYAMGGEGVSADVSNGVLDLLERLGPVGVQRLTGEIGDERGARLFVRTAAAVRSGVALPGLAAVVKDAEFPEDLRREALDSIVGLVDGPRVEILHAVASDLPVGALRQRARLLFWNYL